MLIGVVDWGNDETKTLLGIWGPPQTQTPSTQILN